MRGQFINQLVLKISRGENFGIFGLRKIGKTSLVYRLRELSRDHLVAYVDLQGVASRRVGEVYARLLDLKRWVCASSTRVFRSSPIWFGHISQHFFKITCRPVRLSLAVQTAQEDPGRIRLSSGRESNAVRRIEPASKSDGRYHGEAGKTNSKPACNVSPLSIKKSSGCPSSLTIT